tara:strand:- start:300 stop:1121 length:822 start_codon:yes stop_codon:yes gene_type:complete
MDIITLAKNFIIEHSPRVLTALILYFIGSWIIKKILTLMEKYLKKMTPDLTLFGFFSVLTNAVLKLILFITIASIIGIPMTTFIGVLSAASLAIGIALKDSLSNLAGGILILITRPFNVGDFIEFDGSIGTVKDIQLLHTAFNSPDNKRVIIPNGDIMTKKIINYTFESTRRIDLIFSASYSDNYQHVITTIENVIASMPLILEDPAPVVRMMSHSESSVDYITKTWCKKEDYWTVHHTLHEQIFAAFKAEGITIPFPQRVVYQTTSRGELNE